MMGGRLVQWLLHLVAFAVSVPNTGGSPVNITILQSAAARGAVCLDGSPPAYHLDRGFGTGINSWLVHMEGGGWCHNMTSCLARKNTRLGSSRVMAPSLAFMGILNNRRQFNPDFYNWNRVKIRYCDGSSFTGDIEAVNPATNLHFRGQRIFLAVMEELLAKGMKNAENAMISGCSAGGLTSILHCDSFKALLPMGTKVKCLSDAGYFVDVRDVSGARHIRAYFNDVVTTHGSAKNLPQSCTKKMNSSLCFFPQNVAKQIRTPLFLLNAAYDSWQLRNILLPGAADPTNSWSLCKLDIQKCTAAQLTVIQGFRMKFLISLNILGFSESRGMFINSCFDHCQTELQELWQMKGSPVLRNKTVARAVGDWFYDRSPFQTIDCPYPCDKSCQNLVLNAHDHPLI